MWHECKRVEPSEIDNLSVTPGSYDAATDRTKPVTLNIFALKRGARYRLTLSNCSANAGAKLTAGGVTVALPTAPGRVSLEFIHDGNAPRIDGYTSGNLITNSLIWLYLWTVEPHAYPYATLTVTITEALRLKNFILGKSILGRDRLSKLWGQTLPAAGPAIDITGPVTALRITRGVKSEFCAYKPDVSSLEIDLLNLGVEIWRKFEVGAIIQVLDALSREPVFTGVLTREIRTPLKTRGAREAKYTLIAVDLVAVLTSIERYGCTAYEKQTVDDRVADLLDKHMILHEKTRVNCKSKALLEESTNKPLSRTVYQSSLANHLDLAMRSVAGYWYVNRNNQVVYYPTRKFWRSGISMSDVRDPSYVDIDSGYDTDKRLTEIQIENISAEYSTEDSGYRETRYTYNARTYYGYDPGTPLAERVVNHMTNLWRAPGLAIIMNEPLIPLGMVYDYETKYAQRGPSRVLLNAVRTPKYRVLELMQIVDVEFHREKNSSLILGLTHEITPKSWMITATLEGKLIEEI